MDASHIADEFRKLSSAAQIETLVRLAWELTVVGRDTYVPGSLDLRYPRRLRSLNEVQHRITSHVRALLTEDTRRYPDEVLVSIILEENDPELHRQIAAAFARSLPQPTAA
jgi:hypothetical protein